MKSLEHPPEWHAQRRTAIGGSDVHRILFGDAYGVWLEKKGLVEPTPDNEFLRLGRRLESAILEEYAERTGFTLWFPEFVRHPEHSFLGGNLDALAITPYNDKRVVDAKNVDRSKMWQWQGATDFEAEEYESEDGEETAAAPTVVVPEPYALQIQHYCFVVGASVGDLAALFGGNRFDIFEIPFDEELYCGMILPKLKEFWENHVEKNVPPDPDFSHPRALDTQRRLHTAVIAEANMVPATQHELDLIRRNAYAKALEKAAKAVKSRTQAELLHIAGDRKETAIGRTGIVLKRSEIASTFVSYEKKGYVRLSVNGLSKSELANRIPDTEEIIGALFPELEGEQEA